ncbi:unnamed protein product [Lupinus luteus]|uniref:Non-haem dioxygenase N-terminal domain-containing protein n=1 Tax=Lupinus luteus TaxID=3873 RepID=A0AAV1WN45_LUPLU
MQLETQKNNLELRKTELEKREAHNESERKKFSEEIKDIVNHGVSIELLESLKDAAQTFFNLPPVKKARYLPGVSPSPIAKYGTSFVPEKEKSLEWKDYISMIYSNDEQALQHWPGQCKYDLLYYVPPSKYQIFDRLIDPYILT